MAYLVMGTERRAQVTEYERFIQHVLDGVEQQKDIAELMDKPKGAISKWARPRLCERDESVEAPADFATKKIAHPGSFQVSMP